MADVEKLSATNVLLVMQFVAPGFLIVYFRSLFVRRIEAQFKDNVLLYVTLSIIYGFLSAPLLSFVAPSPIGWWKWLIWLVTLIMLPVALGVSLGVATQTGRIKSALDRVGLRPLSPYRTGWDWAFSQTTTPAYLLVTMEDGSQVAGLFGDESLAASEHTNRDLLLEVAFEIDDQGNWTERSPRQAMLIAGKSIRYVEFFQGG